jgi:hypothetical protein
VASQVRAAPETPGVLVFKIMAILAVMAILAIEKGSGTIPNESVRFPLQMARREFAYKKWFIRPRMILRRWPQVLWPGPVYYP